VRAIKMHNAPYGIVFLRGVNVGGHRTFRPSIVARELSDFQSLRSSLIRFPPARSVVVSANA